MATARHPALRRQLSERLELTARLATGSSGLPSGTRIVIPSRDKEKRAVAAARIILSDIREHGLRPGDRLPPEATLVARYGVARSTLREALRILEVQGLIRIRFGPGGGAEVRTPTPLDFSQVLTLNLQGIGVTFRHLLEARRAVEPVMAMLAADSDDAEQRADLSEVLHRTAAAVEADDFAEAMGAFHSRVLNMSGNPVLEIWILALRQAMRDPREAPLPGPVCEAIRREHLAIGEAIMERDGLQAQALMAEHMARSAEYTGHDDGYLDQPVEWG